MNALETHCERILRDLGRKTHANCLQAKWEIKKMAESARRGVGQRWRHAKAKLNDEDVQ